MYYICSTYAYGYSQDHQLRQVSFATDSSESVNPLLLKRSCVSASRASASRMELPYCSECRTCNVQSSASLYVAAQLALRTGHTCTILFSFCFFYSRQFSSFVDQRNFGLAGATHNPHRIDVDVVHRRYDVLLLLLLHRSSSCFCFTGRLDDPPLTLLLSQVVQPLQSLLQLHHVIRCLLTRPLSRPH